MRAVVFGSEGFLGANLCKMLMECGHDVVGTSLHRRHHTSLDALQVACRVEYGDVTDPAFVERILSTHEAQWVFHLAAVSIVRVAQSSPARAYQTNVMGTVNVLEACRKLGTVQAIVVASSDKAYGDHGGKPYTENMPLLPVAPYEVSKAAADLIAQSYAATYDMPVKITRCANLYGPGDLNWSRLIPNSCRQANRHEPPIVHAGSTQMQREYLHVEDACRAYITLAECGWPGAYNVGSGDWSDTQWVAETIAELMDAPAPIVQIKHGAAFHEIPKQHLCADKIRALGWKPEVRLIEGLARTIQWYREYLAAERVLVCVS